MRDNVEKLSFNDRDSLCLGVDTELECGQN